MPLLGRHKSSIGSSAGSSSTGTTSVSSPNRQQVCESPLFGTRRQLNIGSSDTNGGKSAPNNQLLKSNNKTDPPLNVLSSIPQQITRQQIHYAFSMMDTNKDGHVDVRDLSQMLSNLGIPIDEGILFHIMKNTVSKQGDHRISEAEFLDWISHLIEIQTESPVLEQQRSPRAQRSALRVTRSSTIVAGSSLAAQPNEVPRTRRGSGSGLALMRSLSSSSSKPSGDQQEPTTAASTAPAGKVKAIRRSSKKSLQSQPSTDSTTEAKYDLKAAFCVFDLDGDGYITLDEVRAGLKLLGESWSPAELSRLFSKCGSSPTSDLNKQRISIDDFVQLLL